MAAAPSFHNRIVHLERLVKSLMPPARAPETLMDERSESECGSMRLSASEVRYVGGDHWAAILDSIADLEDHFDREENFRLVDSPDQVQNYDGDPIGGLPVPHALLLYGCKRATSRAEILAALPPKSAVDRYVSRFFNCLDLVASCQCTILSILLRIPMADLLIAAVHAPSFLREASILFGFSADCRTPDIDRCQSILIV